MLKNGVLVLAAVLVGGCGGGDTLSKEQYASKLSAACADFREQEREIGEPQTLADLVEKGPRVLEAFERTIVDSVHSLKAPDEIGDQADRMVELADQQRDVLGELIAAARKSEVAKVTELAAKNAALNEEANSSARKLGATACAGD